MSDVRRLTSDLRCPVDTCPAKPKMEWPQGPN